VKPQPAGNEFAAFIGIDWADAKHDICLQAANAARRESSGGAPGSRRRPAGARDPLPR
jgi:hypothetical protein